MAVKPTQFVNPQALEQGVVDWLESVYDEAETEMSASPELKLTGKLIDYICGRQWSPNARFGRSRPVSNRLFRQFVEMVGLLTDIEPDFKVTFADKRDGFSQLEELLNDMIQIWAEMSDFEMELSQTVMYGLLHTGWGKVQWNGTLNYGMGDNQYLPISPVNIMEVGTQDRTRDAEALIYRYPATLAFLRRKYGKVAEAVRPEGGMVNAPAQMMRPAKISATKWATLPDSLKKMLGRKGESSDTKYPIALVKEFWMRDDTIWEGSESVTVGNEDANWSYIVEPGMLLYPRGRLIVYAGRKVLEDTCNPYWHGFFPFAKYRPLRVPWSASGQSIMEPLAAMQNILNRINGGVMDTINAAIEPTLIAPKGAFSQQSWDSMDPTAPGGKLQYNNNTPKPPEFRKPPELASYIMQFAGELMKEQDATSGAAAIGQALQKKQVPGGDALDMIMNSRSTNIRLMGRSLKSFLTEIGQMTVCNFLQFSTAKSRAAMFGGRGLTDYDFEGKIGSMLPGGMKSEAFVRSASFSIRKGSLLAIEKQEEMPILFGLRKAGDLSRKRLYAKLDKNFPVKLNDDELMEEQLQKASAAALVSAASGKNSHGHKK